MPLPPHAPLTSYYADEEERQGYIRRIFDETAGDYDRIERVLALGSGSWYRRKALERAGLVAREALKLIGPAGSLIGIDPSPGMMLQVHLPSVTLLEGRAEALPRPDTSADFLSMGYALRHVGDLSSAFAEFFRVLRPGARLLLLEITKPNGGIATALLRAYMRAVVPLIARLVARRAETSELWRYYWDTIEACVAPEQVMSALRLAGFSHVKRGVELGVFSEYTAVKPT